MTQQPMLAVSPTRTISTVAHQPPSAHTIAEETPTTSLAAHQNNPCWQYCSASAHYLSLMLSSISQQTSIISVAAHPAASACSIAQQTPIISVADHPTANACSIAHTHYSISTVAHQPPSAHIIAEETPTISLAA